MPALKHNPGTILAFDFGLTQIGVAVGNNLLGTSQPLPILRAREGQPNWQELTGLIEEWRPGLLVVGDPLNMDGTDSELSLRARKFARRLQGRLSLPVQLVDERLSSYDAKLTARNHGHRGDFKARPIDSHAAQLILQTWFAEQATAGD